MSRRWGRCWISGPWRGDSKVQHQLPPGWRHICWHDFRWTIVRHHQSHKMARVRSRVPRREGQAANRRSRVDPRFRAKTRVQRSREWPLTQGVARRLFGRAEVASLYIHLTAKASLRRRDGQQARLPERDGRIRGLLFDKGYPFQNAKKLCIYHYIQEIPLPKHPKPVPASQL